MNCTTVRVRAEFDIDIQHHWCWLKWWDSLRCSPVPVVEPRERCEHAYAYDHGRATQPFIEVPGVRDHFCALPPEQHPAPNAEPDGGPDEIAEAQMDDRLEPRYYCEAKGEPEEQHDGNKKRCYETHRFTDIECCTSDTRRRCRNS